MSNPQSRIIELADLARWVLANRERLGWSQAELARRVTNAGYPISQNKIHRLEHYDEFDLKRIDVEFIFWLEEVFDAKFLPPPDGDFIEVSLVLDLINAMKSGADQPQPSGDARLRKIHDEIASLLSRRPLQNDSQARS